jgi:hypothetical protein
MLGKSKAAGAAVVALVVVLLTPAAAHLAVKATVTTALSSAAVTTGTAVTDQATLSGVAKQAAGTVTYNVYTSGSCTGTPVFTSVVTVTNATAPPSAPFTATPAGSYQWQAVYRQFPAQAGILSACGSEPLAVTNAPTVTTQLSSPTAVQGAVVTDSATLGGSTSDAGGTVTYNVYTSANCTGTPVFTSTVAVTNGSVPASAGYTVGSAGLYQWQAAYSGDAKNQPASSVCGSETLTVVSTFLSTQLSETVATTGDQVTDQATLIGVTSNAGGTLTYSVYTSTNCTGATSFTSTVPVTAGTAPPSAPFTASPAGAYQWQASYSGDGTNAPMTSTCGSEQLAVKNQPSISTTLSESSGLKDDAVTDQATLPGSTADAGGTVTYNVYSTSDCSGTPVFTSAVTVTNGQVPVSGAFIADPIGTYQWQATYGGDAKNRAVAAPCGSEPLTVSAAPLVPLIDIPQGSTYYGFGGGEYANGTNTMPAAHVTDGLTAANAITPLAADGTPSSTGKIGLLSIGASAQSLEWCGSSSNCLSTSNASFMTFAAASPSVNHSSLVIVNGAQSADPAPLWTSPTNKAFDMVRDQRLAPAGLTEKQVEIVWIENADKEPSVSLPAPGADAYTLESELASAVRAVKIRYPNVKEVFLSSRIYGGYATTTQNPEPYAYESGFAVKWLIQAQINQMATGVVDPVAGDLNENGVAPWIAWGPYIWADGATPNSQGLFYVRNDFQPDGTHPNFNGTTKVGNMLMNFFLGSQFTTCWFPAAPTACQ